MLLYQCIAPHQVKYNFQPRTQLTKTSAESPFIHLARKLALVVKMYVWLFVTLHCRLIILTIIDLSAVFLPYEVLDV